MADEMLLPAEVEYIIDTLRSAGYRADVVGGAVRDHLLGRESYDFDITTAAHPDEVKRVFRSHRTVDTGIKHGTVTLVLEGGSYEITTWRVDGDYLDSRHPDTVSFTRSLSEDLARRDFTVNAICYNPHDGYTDMYDGIGDLERGVIRAVGDPERRFDEDALRIMRAVRFAAALGFSLEEGTASAALKKRELLSRVSAERIYAELKKMLSAPGSYEAAERYRDIILAVLPELGDLRLPDRALYKASSYTARLIALFLLNAGSPAEAYLSAMNRLKTDSDQRAVGERALSLLDTCDPKNVYGALKLLSVYGEREAELALELGTLVGRYGAEHNEAFRRAMSSGVPYRISSLAVGGRELMALGFSGKAVGEALAALLDAVMRGECENSAEALLGVAERML